VPYVSDGNTKRDVPDHDLPEHFLNRKRSAFRERRAKDAHDEEGGSENRDHTTTL